MSHHFQILSLCERKNLRDLCRESNPEPLNYMSRAHYLYHWIRDLDLASSFLKQPKMRDLGVHFLKIFRGRAPDPPFSRGLCPLRPVGLRPSPPPSQNIFLRLCFVQDLRIKHLEKTSIGKYFMLPQQNVVLSIIFLCDWSEDRMYRKGDHY